MITKGMQTSAPAVTTKALMSAEEAAHYMGIPLEDFQMLIEAQIKQKANLPSYDTYRFIPYIDIGSNRLFNQEEINKWIEYNMINK
ncbi:hypothetical protein [Ammoniphilus sp. YIM 78166]|uniref:hypothetical protein n=1 Tax=Ammoniphilus sp. YIM 78166 TaxID=1644106 RepID=UPI0014305467|nr:hypothetical protein [Ammoniphilus sp. YIM 78166]